MHQMDNNVVDEMSTLLKIDTLRISLSQLCQSFPESELISVYIDTLGKLYKDIDAENVSVLLITRINYKKAA